MNSEFGTRGFLEIPDGTRVRVEVVRKAGEMIVCKDFSHDRHVYVLNATEWQSVFMEDTATLH
jgi:hypothetical protein